MYVHVSVCEYMRVWGGVGVCACVCVWVCVCVCGCGGCVCEGVLQYVHVSVCVVWVCTCVHVFMCVVGGNLCSHTLLSGEAVMCSTAQYRRKRHTDTPTSLSLLDSSSSSNSSSPVRKNFRAATAIYQVRVVTEMRYEL